MLKIRVVCPECRAEIAENHQILLPDYIAFMCDACKKFHEIGIKPVEIDGDKYAKHHRDYTMFVTGGATGKMTKEYRDRWGIADE